MTDEPTNDTRVEVLPVPEGSIIWLHNIDLGFEDDPDQADCIPALISTLRRATGHERFCILQTSGEGKIEAFGAGDVDQLVERVRAAIEPATVEVCNTCHRVIRERFTQKNGSGQVVGEIYIPCRHGGGFSLRRASEIRLDHWFDPLIGTTPEDADPVVGEIIEALSKPLCAVCGRTVEGVLPDSDFDSPGDPGIQWNQPCGHAAKREPSDG